MSYNKSLFGVSDRQRVFQNSLPLQLILEFKHDGLRPIQACPELLRSAELGCKPESLTFSIHNIRSQLLLEIFDAFLSVTNRARQCRAFSKSHVALVALSNHLGDQIFH